MAEMLDELALLGGTATARVLSTSSLVTRENNIYTDYTNGTALPQGIDGLHALILQRRQQPVQLAQAFSTFMLNTLILMAQADTPGTLSTPGAAMTLLVNQMKTNSNTINRSVVTFGAQTNNPTAAPVGNPSIVMSSKQGNGLILEYILAETLTFTCISDAQTGGATAGNETLSIVGQPSVPNFAYNWPQGSGYSGTLACVDGSKNNPTTGNILQNSDFAVTTTANTPDNWTIQVGSAGTDIKAGTVNPPAFYTTNGGALEFIGTGGALLDAVTQSFSTTPTPNVGAGGTSYVLKPDTTYHCNLWYKLGTASPAAGVLEVALTDGSTYPGAVQNDDQATANSFNVNLNTIGDTNWHILSGAIRTPSAIPTTVPPFRLRLRLSTALTSPINVTIGRMSMTPAFQLYPPQGPMCSIHSGNVNLVAAPFGGSFIPDIFTLAPANTMGLFQQNFLRFFGMPTIVPGGLIIPSSTTPSIADSILA